MFSNFFVGVVIVICVFVFCWWFGNFCVVGSDVLDVVFFDVGDINIFCDVLG